MKAFIQLCLATALLPFSLAYGQWQWVDESGRKVFSDQPPPQHIAADKVLKRPKNAAAPLTAPALHQAPKGQPPHGVASATTSTATQRKPPAADQHPSQTPAAPSSAPEVATAAAKAEDCQRAQRNKATLSSGRTVSFMNAKGERELMTDQMRQEELAYLDEVIARQCG